MDLTHNESCNEDQLRILCTTEYDKHEQNWLIVVVVMIMTVIMIATLDFVIIIR